jgi:hypothetical protein
VTAGICRDTGKFAFASPHEAVCKLGKLQRRHHGRGSLRVYRCRFCGLWHHGRRGAQKPRGMRKA